MSKESLFSVVGIVVEKFPAARFAVKLENGHTITAIISGKIRQNNIIISVGDNVDVEMSIYDLNQGRIVYRHKD